MGGRREQSAHAECASRNASNKYAEWYIVRVLFVVSVQPYNKYCNKRDSPTRETYVGVKLRWIGVECYKRCDDDDRNMIDFLSNYMFLQGFSFRLRVIISKEEYFKPFDGNMITKRASDAK